MKATIKNVLSRNPTVLAAAKRVYRAIKPYRRSFSMVRFDELYSFSIDFARKLPNEFDVVIGIPRSGLIVANLLANAMGRSLATPELFLEGKIWHSKDVDCTLVKKVLVVEDAVNIGRDMKKVVADIQAFDKALDVKTASLFVTQKGIDTVDYCYAILNNPAFFEWNLLSSTGNCVGALTTDFDGVLCRDCPDEVSKNQLLYEKWIENVEPYFIPAFEIEAIITARLEKYRPQTENWLERHGVKYKRLIMLNLPSERDRTFERIVHHKARSILEVKPKWYWESSLVEAKAIHHETKLPVLCVQQMEFLGGKRKDIKILADVVSYREHD